MHVSWGVVELPFFYDRCGVASFFMVGTVNRRIKVMKRRACN